MPSKLIFNSKYRRYSVYSCACGCDVPVKVSNDRVRGQLVDLGYYVGSHAPKNVSDERIGPAYYFDSIEDEPQLEERKPEPTKNDHLGDLEDWFNKHLWNDNDAPDLEWDDSEKTDPMGSSLWKPNK